MFLKNIITQFREKSEQPAFCISGVFYTYRDLEKRVSGILDLLKKNAFRKSDFALVETRNDIETYATILAVWFAGGVFVPVNPRHPEGRNRRVREQVNAKLSLSSSGSRAALNTRNVLSDKTLTYPDFFQTKDLLYVLFTSGSTGIPKGVCITHANFSAFIQNFLSAGYRLSSKDRFLQIYDLTFDASLHSWVLPLTIGASVYTAEPSKPKYLQAYKLMQEHKISFAKFPPSLLMYLRPYFKKIKLPHLRYSLCGGEAFSPDLSKDWSACVPNAEIHNVYGPTEATVNTHIYKFELDKIKTCNGSLSIGKSFGTNTAFVFNKKNELAETGERGELCLCGEQLSPGYFNNKKKNKEAFFEKEINGQKMRFYRTGDTAFIDPDGDTLFCGRGDEQFQVNGYRVEAGEIEQAAQQFSKNYAFIADFKPETGIRLFAEKMEDAELEKLKQHLKTVLPDYMLPKIFISLKKFPQTPGGKIDRGAVKNLK